MVTSGRIHQTIHAVYDAFSRDPRGFAALDVVREAIGAEHVVLRRHHGNRELFLTCSQLRAASADMRTLHAGWLHSGWGIAARTTPFNDVVSLSSSADLSSVQASPVYHDLLKPIGGGLSVLFRFQDAGSGDIIACRSAERPLDFSQTELARLRLLGAHLITASRVALTLRQAEQERRQSDSLLDGLPDGVILLDGSGRVLRTNRMAERLCGRESPLHLGRLGLSARDPIEEGRLRAALTTALEIDRQRWADAPSRAPIRLAFSRPPPHHPLLARILPGSAIGDPGEHAGPHVLVLLNDPEAVHIPDAAEIRLRLSLTPRESQLAAALARGSTLTDAARELGITPGTARQYLKSIFARTGTNSQAALMRLLRP